MYEGEDPASEEELWNFSPRLRSQFVEKRECRMSEKNEEIDPELLALADPKHDTILKPFLMITVILMGFWVINDWQQELQYFFQSSTPVDLGDSMEMGSKTEKIPHNTFVTTTGIPTRRSNADRYRYFSLVGSKIFVEQKRDDYIEDPLEREINGNKGDVDRVYFRGNGRILHFSKLSGRYNGLRTYYSKRYNTGFCEQMSPSVQAELKQRQLDSFLLYKQKIYDAASEEVRLEKSLKRKPTEEEIRVMAEEEPICIDAYLLQADIAPKNHVGYLIASILFAFFMLFNFFLLIKWIKRFLGK